MTITIRQKALANDNISLYLDIYDGGKRKFEFLSLYLLGCPVRCSEKQMLKSPVKLLI